MKATSKTMASSSRLRDFLLFVVLGTVGMVFMYQWRLQKGVYTIRYFIWNIELADRNTPLINDITEFPHLTVNIPKTNNETLEAFKVNNSLTNATADLSLQSTKPTQKDVLCFKPEGGIGNMLFLYGSTYGIASRLNRTVHIHPSAKLDKLFNLTAQVVDKECEKEEERVKLSKFNCAFDADMFNIPKGNTYRVGSYLQSFKYFEHVAEDLRGQLKFDKTHMDKAASIIQDAVKHRNISNGSVVTVGVHIRRGDFVNHVYGYDVATPEYMQKAMAYYRTKYGNVVFVVCSNDMTWSKLYVKGDDVHYVGGNSYDMDMAVLVSCDHSLTTVGTFGWWAGFLAGGDVVYYQWPAKEKSDLRAHFRYDDFFPPSWIGMK